jgi:AraC-like DNA-binding protein
MTNERPWPTPTICYGLVQHIAESVARLGFSGELAHARFPGTDPSFEAPVPAQQLHDLWEEVRVRSGEVGWGLRVAELDRERDLGALGAAVRHAATLGEALVHHSRLLRLFTQSVGTVLTVGGDHTFYELQCPYPDLIHPESVEHLLADFVWVLDVRRSGTEARPAVVHVRHRRPGDLTHHERVLGLEVRFEASGDGLAFGSAQLLEPRGGVDPARRAEARRLADQALQAHEPHETLVRRVEAVIATELTQGPPRLDLVAERLGVHPKALSRRLAAQGVGYKDLLDHVRRHLAYRHLSSPLTLEEVAYRLGYSEAAAFTRAFRRWTGTSPGAYRAAKRRPRHDGPPEG